MKRRTRNRLFLILVMGVTLWNACSSEVSNLVDSKTEVKVMPLIDETGPSLVAIAPYDGLSGVLTTIPVVLMFDEDLSSSSLTTQSNGKCEGSLQLSDDDFRTCIPLRTPALNNNNQLVSLKPINPLNYTTKYKLKISETISDNRSNQMLSSYEMQIGFTTIAKQQETLPNQIANELEQSLKIAAGLAKNARNLSSLTSTLNLTLSQISTIRAKALNQVKQTQNYYASDLSDVLGAMSHGAMIGVGEAGIQGTQRIQLLTVLAETFLRSTLGLKSFVQDEQNLVTNLLKTMISQIPSAGSQGEEMVDGVVSITRGIINALDETGMSESAMEEALGSVLEQVPPAAAALLADGEKSRQLESIAALSSKTLNRLKSTMSRVAESAVEGMSNWYNWDSKEESWADRVSTGAEKMTSALDDVAGLNVDDAEFLMAEIANGMLAGLSNLEPTGGTTSNDVATAIGRRLMNAVSNLTFGDGSKMDPNRAALLIQKAAQTKLQGLDPKVLASLNNGLVNGVKDAGGDGDAVQTALGVNSTPDTIAPIAYGMNTTFGITNQPIQVLNFEASELGTYQENCSKSSGSFSKGKTSLTLNSLADGVYSNCGLTLTDAVDNSRTVPFAKFTVDTVQPQLSNFTLNDGAISTTSPTLNLRWTASDELSGLNYYYVGETASPPKASDGGWRYHLSTSTCSRSGNNYSCSYTLVDRSKGDRELHLWVRDQAGNISKGVTAQIRFQDTTGPSIYDYCIEGANPCRFNNVSFTNKLTVDLYISAADDFSGIVGYYTSENFTSPSPTAAAWQSYSAPKHTFLSTADGTKLVYLWLQDGEGNLSSSADTITLDRTPPDYSSFLIADGASEVNRRQAPLTIVASDTSSGLSHYYSSESVSPTPTADQSGWQDINTDNFHLIDNASLGTKQIFTWIRDTAGNISGPKSDTINLIDNESPVIKTFLIDNGEAYTNKGIVTLTIAGEDLVGLAGYYLNTTGIAPAATDNWTAIPGEVLNHSISLSQAIDTAAGTSTFFVWYKDTVNQISERSEASITYTPLAMEWVTQIARESEFDSPLSQNDPDFNDDYYYRNSSDGTIKASIIDDQGNVYLAGSINCQGGIQNQSSQADCGYVWKFDGNGNRLWKSRMIFGDYEVVTGLRLNSDSTISALITAYNNDNQTLENYLVKLRQSNGAEIDSIQLADSASKITDYNQYNYSLITNYLRLGGYQFLNGGDILELGLRDNLTEAWVAKYTYDGQLLQDSSTKIKDLPDWVNTYHKTYYLGYLQILPDQNGNFYLSYHDLKAVIFNSSKNYNESFYESYVGKFDSNYSILWEKDSYGLRNEVNSINLLGTIDEALILVKEVSNSPYNDNLTKLDSTGNIEWFNDQIFYDYNTFSNQILINKDKIYVAGSNFQNDTSNGIKLVKISNDSQLEWTFTDFETNSVGIENLMAIQVNSSDDIFVTGMPNLYGTYYQVDAPSDDPKYGNCELFQEGDWAAYYCSSSDIDTDNTTVGPFLMKLKEQD